MVSAWSRFGNGCGARLLLAIVIATWAAWAGSEMWSAPGYDLSALVVGAKVLRDGDAGHLYDHNPVYYNLADSPEFTRAAAQLGFEGTSPTPFVHPPLLAAAAAPMTTTPFRLITRAWLIASLALTIIGVWLAFRLYAPRWSAPVPLALTFAFLGAFEPVRYALWLGQTTPLVFAMVLWSLWLLRKQRDATAGLLLSIPVFLKLTPVVFALVWAWQRRGRALAGLTVGLAGLVLLSILTVGLDANAAYVHRVSEIARITLVTFNNHSLPALLTRLSFDHPNVSAFTMLPQPAWVRWTVASTMAGATGLMLVVTRHGRSEDGALLEAYGMLALLLVPSIAWTHYFVFLLPAALGLRACLPEGRHQRLVGIAGLAMLAFCARPLVTDQTAFDPSRHGMIATPTCGALGMLALLGAVAWRQRPRAVAGNTIPGRPLAGCGAGARS